MSWLTSAGLGLRCCGRHTDDKAPTREALKVLTTRWNRVKIDVHLCVPT